MYSNIEFYSSQDSLDGSVTFWFLGAPVQPATLNAAKTVAFTSPSASASSVQSSTSMSSPRMSRVKSLNLPELWPRKLNPDRCDPPLTSVVYSLISTLTESTMFGRSTSNFDRLLEKATSQLLLEPDWTSIMMICDSIRWVPSAKKESGVSRTRFTLIMLAGKVTQIQSMQ